MSILKVARMGNPVLRQKAAKLSEKEILSPNIQLLIDNLIETMREYTGVGLAAPQVHESKSIVVIESMENPRYPKRNDIPLLVLINPIITPLTEEKITDWEGCLSLPDLRGLVPRFTEIRVQAYDRKGKKLDFNTSGFPAVVIQHETDHLQGILYIDRVEDLTSLTFMEEYIRYWHKSEEE